VRASSDGRSHEEAMRGGWRWAVFGAEMTVVRTKDLCSDLRLHKSHLKAVTMILTDPRKNACPEECVT
jgi:hypothetical protein